MLRDRRSGILSRHRIEIGEHLGGDLQSRRLQVFTKMGERRCSGDYEDIWRAMEQPRERDLHGRGMEARCRLRQCARLQGTEPAKWEERYVGDAVVSKRSDER